MPAKRYHIVIPANASRSTKRTANTAVFMEPMDDLARHLHPPLANPEPLPSTSYCGPKKKKPGKKSVSSPAPRGSSRKKN